MSDPIMQKLNAMQARCDTATEGPWERGYRYHVQASTHCECRAIDGPLVGIDPDGEYGEMHIHLKDTPIWGEGITARDDSTGGIAVVVETSEYGTMSDGDAEFIAAARTDLPKLIAALRAVLAQHYPHDCSPEHGSWCSPCWSEGLCEGCSEDWPCPTVKAIAEALEADR